MSWNVSAIGKVPAVRESIAKQFSQAGPCHEPEETLRQASAALIDAVLANQDQPSAVKVVASGTVNYANWESRSGPLHNVQIEICPLYGFLE